jgi:putative ATPase
VDGLFDYGPAGETRGTNDSGGTLAGNTHASAPLAVRMRPRTLDELVGQQHLLAAGSPLRRLIEGDQPMSLLLWGPPGTGKTTVAAVVSQQTNRRFVEVSAVAAGSGVARRSTRRAPRSPGGRERCSSSTRCTAHQGRQDACFRAWRTAG